MDNICHTLTGAALGEAGLKRRTGYGTATLMIASNLPDLDVLVFFTDTAGFAFRRGITHGILAQAVLPVALAGVMWGIGRVAPRKGAPHVDTHFGWLVALSSIGCLSHVFLDYLNNYGVRLLAPFDWTWFYGDAVFIADLFLWTFLGAGVWLARRRGRPVFARAGLVAATGYIVAMLVATRVSRPVVAEAWETLHGSVPERVMVGPIPITPFTRVTIIDAGDRYGVGQYNWRTGEVTFETEFIPKNEASPDVARAKAQSRRVREFLVWARFPAWTIAPVERGREVTVFDLRFMSRPVNGATFQAQTIVEASGASRDSSRPADQP